MDAAAWQTVLAFYQASQMCPCVPVNITYEEMRSAGELIGKLEWNSEYDYKQKRQLLSARCRDHRPGEFALVAASFECSALRRPGFSSNSQAPCRRSLALNCRPVTAINSSASTIRPNGSPMGTGMGATTVPRSSTVVGLLLALLMIWKLAE